MLSSSPAVPISSINWSDDNRRRLSLVTEHGREFNTAHDGLPSPRHLTPISGNTPAATTPDNGSPFGSDAGSAAVSRRTSEADLLDGGASLRKVPSRGGLWHDEVSLMPNPSSPPWPSARFSSGLNHLPGCPISWRCVLLASPSTHLVPCKHRIRSARPHLGRRVSLSDRASPTRPLAP